MENLSPHFSFKELALTNHKQFLESNLKAALLKKGELTALANYLLEPLRFLLKTPLKINSGYRCPALNKAVGGSKNSQHLKGEAADFIPLGLDLRQSFEIIKSSPLHYGQLILEPGWIHISLGAPFRELEKCGQIIIK